MLTGLADDEIAVAMARKYIWWQSPDRTLAEPRLLLSQMMTLATVEDVRWLLSSASEDDLRAVLRDPPIGIFNGRSWSYWHRRLNGEPIPPLARLRLRPTRNPVGLFTFLKGVF